MPQNDLFTLVTNRGLAIQATSTANNEIAPQIVKMVFGDGTDVPNGTETELENLRYTADVIEAGQLPDSPNTAWFDAIIPPEIGGFNISELGLLDENDELIVIGHFAAPRPKPVIADGGAENLKVRMTVVWSSLAHLNLILALPDEFGLLPYMTDPQAEDPEQEDGIMRGRQIHSLVEVKLENLDFDVELDDVPEIRAGGTDDVAPLSTAVATLLDEKFDKTGGTIDGQLSVAHHSINLGRFGSFAPLVSVWNQLTRVGGFQVTGTRSMQFGLIGNTDGAGTHQIRVSANANGVGRLDFNNQNVWHAGNDGAGSGLDADLLDGVQGSLFPKLNTTNTYTQPNFFNGSTRLSTLTCTSFATFSSTINTQRIQCNNGEVRSATPDGGNPQFTHQVASVLRGNSQFISSLNEYRYTVRSDANVVLGAFTFNGVELNILKSDNTRARVLTEDDLPFEAAIPALNAIGDRRLLNVGATNTTSINFIAVPGTTHSASDISTVGRALAEEGITGLWESRGASFDSAGTGSGVTGFVYLVRTA